MSICAAAKKPFFYYSATEERGIMRVTEAVLGWFTDILSDTEEPNLNYLAESENAISIEVVPCNPVLKRYADGGEVRQVEFVLALRDLYDGDRKENVEAAEFFEKLADLIREKSDAGELPAPDGCEAREMRVLSHGYAISNTQRTVRYQMQLRFTYYKGF